MSKRRFWSYGRRYILLIVLVAVAAEMVLAYTGLAACYRAAKETIDTADLIYKAMQILLMGGPSLKPPLPWMLHVARFLGAAVELSLAFLIVLRLVPDALQWLAYRMPRRQPRVIVCGCGELAEHLALEARRMHKRVVLLDPRCDAPQRQTLRHEGILASDEDPRQEAVLRRALLRRAESLLIATDDDTANLAIAAVAHKVLKAEKASDHEVSCHLLIADAALRTEVQEHFRVRKHSGRLRVIVDDLNHPLAAARQALADYPLDFIRIEAHDRTTVHLVVEGSGATAQALMVHAAHVAHFANEAEGGKQLKITCADASRANFERMVSEYPALGEVCTLEFVALPATRTQSLQTLLACCAADELVTFALANDGAGSNARNLSDGLSLRNLLLKPGAYEGLKMPPQILVYQSTIQGPDAFFREVPHESGKVPVHFFGMIERCMHWENLFHGQIDALAEMIHRDYIERHKGYGPWGELREAERNANRQAAAHVRVKLRALGVYVEPLDAEQTRVSEFEEQERALLARMEHQRWLAEKRLAGWRWGAKDDRAGKINHCLLTWDEMEKTAPDELKKDYEQIDLIPELLQRTGQGIYRQPRKLMFEE